MYIYTYIYIHTYIHIHIRIHVHIHIHIHVHTHIHVHIQWHVHIHIHIHIAGATWFMNIRYTYTHTYTYSEQQVLWKCVITTSDKSTLRVPKYKSICVTTNPNVRTPHIHTVALQIHECYSTIPYVSRDNSKSVRLQINLRQHYKYICATLQIHGEDVKQWHFLLVAFADRRRRPLSYFGQQICLCAHWKWRDISWVGARNKTWVCDAYKRVICMSVRDIYAFVTQWSWDDTDRALLRAMSHGFATHMSSWYIWVLEMYECVTCHVWVCDTVELRWYTSHRR